MEKRLTKEEFLKDLWHPASEKPNIKQGVCCVISAWDSPIRDCRISEVYRMTGEQIREYFNL